MPASTAMKSVEPSPGPVHYRDFPLPRDFLQGLERFHLGGDSMDLADAQKPARPFLIFAWVNMSLCLEISSKAWNGGDSMDLADLESTEACPPLSWVNMSPWKSVTHALFPSLPAPRVNPGSTLFSCPSAHTMCKLWKCQTASVGPVARATAACHWTAGFVASSFIQSLVEATVASRSFFPECILMPGKAAALCILPSSTRNSFSLAHM